MINPNLSVNGVITETNPDDKSGGFAPFIRALTVYRHRGPWQQWIFKKKRQIGLRYMYLCQLQDFKRKSPQRKQAMAALKKYTNILFFAFLLLLFLENIATPSIKT